MSEEITSRDLPTNFPFSFDAANQRESTTGRPRPTTHKNFTVLRTASVTRTAQSLEDETTRPPEKKY